jgi:hypothetical protein
VGFLDVGEARSLFWLCFALLSAGMGAWLGGRARVENWWEWGALEESPALILVDGGWGSSFATVSSSPYLISSIGLLCLSLIDHLCRMFSYMCCLLIFDKDLPDRGWICLMARSGSSYLLSDLTLR